MTLQEQIRLKTVELDKLLNRQKQNNSRMIKRWAGKFVDDNRNGALIDPKPTEIGLKELKRFKIEYLSEPPVESKEMFWENPGISYTPERCFCMICGNLHTVAWLQYGMCPRFAVCAKHLDFLHIGYQLKKVLEKYDG